MKLETPWKCYFDSSVFCFCYLGSAICCCLNLVLKSAAFIAVLEMSHFPGWGRLRKMGLSTVKREFTRTCRWFNESMGGHAQLSFGGKKTWLQNLSLTCCEMKNRKHFLAVCWSIAHAQFTHDSYLAIIDSLTVNERIIIFTSWCVTFTQRS